MLVGFTIAALSTGCKPESAAQVAPTAPAVSAIVAIEQEVTDYDEFVGRTEATETVEVRSRVSGFIQSVEFTDGDRVNAGDLLFRIEPDAYEAIHQQSLAQIDLWKAKKGLADSKLKRTKTLYDIKEVSDEEYDETVSAVKEADAYIVAAEADAIRTALDVKYTQVAAEISGRIDRAYVTPGNMVTGGLGSGTLLTRIVKNSPIFAYVDIDERSLLRYLRRSNANKSLDREKSTSLRDLNIPCFLQLGDETDFPHEGKLDFVENRVDAATGTIRIRAVFGNDDNLLTGGLFVRLRVPVSETYTAIKVPEQCIATDQGAKYVYVVDGDNVAQRRNIQLGSLRDGWRIIKSGVVAGDKVVYRGLQRVRPGKPVQAEIESVPSPAANQTAAISANAATQGASEISADEPQSGGNAATDNSATEK